MISEVRRRIVDHPNTNTRLVRSDGSAALRLATIRIKFMKNTNKRMTVIAEFKKIRPEKLNSKQPIF